MSNNAHDLSTRLLNALDNSYNVVDLHTVNEIISILEKFNITKELLETTRLGKHVNELRRKTTDPTLARRAKVLVKRWRDLVIPGAVASPAHTGSNRSSAEPPSRRLGGTPLTSPALSRQVVSPAVPSPRPFSRPAWGGYESDSQDVILVDDDAPDPVPPAPPAPLAVTSHSRVASPAMLARTHHKPLTPPVKRLPESEPTPDDKKVKRDKKPKKRRSYGRAGTGTETTEEPPGSQWGARNGTHALPTPPAVPAAPTVSSAPAAPSHVGRRRNGERKRQLDPYFDLVNRIPKAGDKKLKTTQELLKQIQSRGSNSVTSPVSPASPGSPGSPDVMLIGPDPFPKVESPLRNGSSEPRPQSVPPAPASPSPLPLEDERVRAECTCDAEAHAACPAAARPALTPRHVLALHHAYLPGVNGTRAPTHPHRYAVRKPHNPDAPGLFASVMPLYKYSDYADDYCVKNMYNLPLCHVPHTEFAPKPPSPPPPKSPPTPRPYPLDSLDETTEKIESEVETEEDKHSDSVVVKTETRLEPKVEAEMIGVPVLEPSERLKAPLLSAEDEVHFDAKPKVEEMEVQSEFETVEREHRTVVKTKDLNLDGRTLYTLCERAVASVPYDYSEVSSAPVVTLPEEEDEFQSVLETALAEAASNTQRDDLGRPVRPENFTEWHECAKLGDLIALPYVVID